MKSAIKVEGLTKVFRVYHDRRFKDSLVSIVKRRPIYDNFIALKNINFEVNKGECLGIIGANGSGKSTLLKLIAGILYPDKGKIEINGKVSTLIELYAGLHDDLTGLENIYLSGAIYGLTKRQLDKRLDDIIKFSGLGNFIDTQSRFFSDGMRARLGFSVAIHVDADILLIDEVLAVGDMEFQEKCYKKIGDLKDKGTSILYVSHILESVERVCNVAIWLDKGSVQLKGRPDSIIAAYIDAQEE